MRECKKLKRRAPRSHIDGQKNKHYNGKLRGTTSWTPPPRYDEAFKAGAVRMVTEQGRPSMEVAKELSICALTRNWNLGFAQASGRKRRSHRHPSHEIDRHLFYSQKAYKSITNSRHEHSISKNLLMLQFSFERPNLAWVGDITYIPIEKGWLYLAIIKDLCTRKS